MVHLFAPAKINLFLAIQGKDESGYHLLDTVFLRTFLLQDEIEIESTEQLQITFLPAEGIDPKDNTVLKAIRLLEAKTGRSFPYQITIRKNIPLGSGLGGGSSDAATVLQFLNEHEQLGYSREELVKLGAEIGMDVPFFLSGYELAHGSHHGEILEPLPSLPSTIKLKIMLSGSVVSTKEAYAQWDEQPTLQKTSEAFRAALQAQDAQEILQNLHNDFQVSYPLPKLNPGEYGVLTGSGSAFAILSLT